MKNNSERKVRRQIPADTKWQILKEGRSTNLTISQVCDQHQISPTLFYQWERAAERGARQALQGQPHGRKKLRPTEEALLTEVQRLREVIAELSSENLRLKKGRW
ncbi:MAG: transposase [Chloroflexi bacterium]|nr:transposase [Chloroflexota bacterium]